MRGDPLRDIGLLSAPEQIVLVAQQGVVRKLTLPERSGSCQT
ncbi:hypothetical protein ACIBI7_23725 [Nonomuraea fuscirosea]